MRIVIQYAVDLPVRVLNVVVFVVLLKGWDLSLIRRDAFLTGMQQYLEGMLQL